MEIKDLTGLSEPLKRLIEVISSGIGAVSAPYLIRKAADAKAYEIKTIAQAMNESQKLLAHSEYEDGKVKLILPESPSQGAPSLTDRTVARLQYQDAREQQNIESVCATAADELSRESTISEEKPESEWISRFMGIAKDISTEEMQYLWGRILAGEIRKPRSFSLRTLEALRNLSKKEAENFVKLAGYVLRSDDKTFFARAKSYISQKEDGLSFTDILDLKDSGLIYESDLEFSFHAAPAGTVSYLLHGPIALLIEREKETPKLGLQVGVLTKVGTELMQLVTVKPDMEYLAFVASNFRRPEVKCAWAPFHFISQRQIQYGEKTYFPSEDNQQA